MFLPRPPGKAVADHRERGEVLDAVPGEAGVEPAEVKPDGCHEDPEPYHVEQHGLKKGKFT